MSIINLLSSKSGKSGSEANIQLAKKLSESEDSLSIKELVDNLKNKDKRIQSDCIKTLYELAYIKPQLIADYYIDFFNLLNSKNNRLVWGSMIAIANITDIKNTEVFSSLDLILNVMNKGSVITIDNGIEILSKLNKYNKYINTIEPVLIEQLLKCSIKQFPMYIEKALVSLSKNNKALFLEVIYKRKAECELASQVKRLDQSIKYINKI